ncbi:MAG: ABC transporter ATP-binding protein [Chloroflexota bacterium]|nr:ABC transporter ATP-binding protein [Chloroflexota bacterium]
MSVAVEFRNVSKRFTLHHDRPRSLRDTFFQLLHGQINQPAETLWALRDVSFTVEEGTTLGIIGPNGSGKSTALKLAGGILEPTEGNIRTQGRASALIELGAGFHPDLTGRENIYLNGAILGLSREEIKRRLDDIVAFSELEDFIDIPVKRYSSGMYMRLGFSIAAHTDPQILLVDEVLAVGDASFQHKCLDRIASLRRSGVTILLVSHALGTIQSLCDQAIWLDQGQLRAQGYPTDVVMAYLNSIAQKEEKEETPQPLSEIERDWRWGTGKVQVTQVEFCDGSGTPRSVFVNGAPMEIRLHYRAEERIEDPNFGLAIYHQNGAHICGPNTNFGGLYIPFVEGEGQVVYHIPSLNLLEGKYLLSIAVVNGEDTETYDYHDRAYSFRVYPGESQERYGLITLNGNWRIETATQPECVVANR